MPKAASNAIAKCLREKANWAKMADAHRFDSEAFNPQRVAEDMHIAGPKLEAMMNKIAELDAADQRDHGHTFKHFIYSDVKSPYGAKLVASALASRGFTHAYALGKSARGKAFVMGAAAPNSFATLTTVAFFGKPLGINFRKEVLQRFNARPDNVHGENLRIVILDSGLREGVDLFDVKYVHLFEPIITVNDQKQAVGRATRFCGQKGLRFDNGWPLQVFRYDTQGLFDLFMEYSNIDVKKVALAAELESVVIEGAADYELTAAFRLAAAQEGGGPHFQPNYAMNNMPKNMSRLVWAREMAKQAARQPFIQERQRKAEEAARRQAEQEAKLAEQRARMLEELRQREAAAEAERRRLAEEEAERQRKGEEERRRRAESLERRRKAEEQERIRKFYEQQRIEEERRRKIAEEEARRRAESLERREKEQRRRAEEEERRRQAEEEDRRRKAEEEERRRQAEEEERRRKAEEEERRKKRNTRIFKLKRILRNVIAEQRRLHERREGLRPPAPKDATLEQIREYVREYYDLFVWPAFELKNGCVTSVQGNNLEFGPTQNFVRHFLTPVSPFHGLLAFHSVGTGKTCTAIATATTHFEPAGWTILYVTKTTLKGDIWKNMFDQICSVVLRKRMLDDGLVIPADKAARTRLLSKSWTAVQPVSYRQFSNMLRGKSALGLKLRAVNGKADPLRKTLIIIDEAHKLFVKDMPPAEKCDVDAVRKALDHSYKHSGANAAKVLLMTGTPYTDEPMDMIRLLNLMLDPARRLPEAFDKFSTEFLDANGHFTEAGRTAFQDRIAGLVSYLNRENDRRTFSYPIMHDVTVPASGTDTAAAKREYARIEGILATTTKALEDIKVAQAKSEETAKARVDAMAKTTADCADNQKHYIKCAKETVTEFIPRLRAVVGDKEQTYKVLHDRAAAINMCNAAEWKNRRSNKKTPQVLKDCEEEVTERFKRWKTKEMKDYELSLCRDILKDRCDPFSTELQKRKEALAELKATHKAAYNQLEGEVKAAQKSQKALAAQIRKAEKEDRSQQAAVKECLASKTSTAS